MAKRHSKSRREFLNEKLKQGSLDCSFCSSKDLIIHHEHDREIPKYRRATVEHLIPISSGINPFDKNNWTVCCEQCNMDRNTEYQKFEQFLKVMGAK